MAPEQIKIFVYRLLNREVTNAELADISIRDLTDINLYLLEHRKVLDLKRWDAQGLEHFVVGSMIVDKPPRNTYTEEEILTELGITA